jgi:hypothetical protein
MIQLLSAIFGLADSALGYVADKKRTELRDRLLSLKKEILEEQAKPVADQNDARLELLYKEVPIIIEAIAIEIQLGITTKKD